MDKGGTALWAIMAVSLLMWILIIERYLYLYYSYPRQLEDVKTAWRHYKNAPLPIAMRLRTGLIRELQVSAGAYLQSITVLSQTLPLLGLLGTVFGMQNIAQGINSQPQCRVVDKPAIPYRIE